MLKQKIFFSLVLLFIFSLSSCSLPLGSQSSEELNDQSEDIDVEQMISKLPKAPVTRKEDLTVKKTYDIAVLVPLTGDFAKIGIPFLNGLKQAKDELNAKNGPKDAEINLLIEDIPCNDFSALKNAKQRISLLDVQLMIVGGCSSDISDLVEFSNTEKITSIVAFSNNFDVDEEKNTYNFYLAPSQDAFVLKVTDFIYKKMDIKDLAVIYESSNFTDKLVKEIKDRSLKISGKELIFTEKNSEDKKGEDLIKKIKDSSAKGLLVISERPKSILPLIRQIQEAKLDIPVIVNEAFSERKILEEIGLETEGLIVFSPKFIENLASEEFLKDYEVKYKEESTYPFYSASGYETMKLLKQAIDWVSYDSQAIRGYLFGIEVKNSLIGDLKFDQKGRLNSLDYDVYLAKNGELKLYDDKTPLAGLNVENGDIASSIIKIEEGSTAKSGDEGFSNRLIIIEE